MKPLNHCSFFQNAISTPLPNGFIAFWNQPLRLVISKEKYIYKSFWGKSQFCRLDNTGLLLKISFRDCFSFLSFFSLSYFFFI